MVRGAQFEEAGIPYKIVAFPRYDKPSSYFIKQYLSLEHPYGSHDEIGPYCASLFYALDRYDASFELRRYLNDGYIVLADRYTGSNVGHQGCKIEDDAERSRFIDWLFDLEFNRMGIPRPATSIILWVPPEIAALRIESRGRGKNAHEVDALHLKKAQAAYLWAAKNYPHDFVTVKCFEEDRELSAIEVHTKVWRVIEDILKSN
jgi:dTMP kinase